MIAIVKICLWLSLGVLSRAIFIPGFSISSYENDEPIPLIAEKVASPNSPLKYDYLKLPFTCSGRKERHGKSFFTSNQCLTLNIGDVILGGRIHTSNFELRMGQDIQCRRLCDLTVKWKSMKLIRNMVEQHFAAKFVVDNLIGARSILSMDRTRHYYSAGFRIGYQDISPSTDQVRTLFNNHLVFVFRWRPAPTGRDQKPRKAIVGFEIYPQSIDASYVESLKTKCPGDYSADSNTPLELRMRPNATLVAEKYKGLSYVPHDDPTIAEKNYTRIPISYSVFWRRDTSIRYWRRWERYAVSELESEETDDNSPKHHAAATMGSGVLVCVLAVAVFMAWTRMSRIGTRQGHPEKTTVALLPLDGDGPKGPRQASSEEEADTAALLKSSQPDLLRTPANSGLFSVLTSAGMQFFFLLSSILFVIFVGMVNPKHNIRSRIVVSTVGVIATLFTANFVARLYKRFGGRQWRRDAFSAVLLLDGLSFAFFFILDLFVWLQSSTVVVPLSTLAVLHAIGLAIQLLLIYVGGCFVNRRGENHGHATPQTSQKSPSSSASYLARHFDLKYSDIPGIFLGGVIPFLELGADVPFHLRNIGACENSTQILSALSTFAVFVALFSVTVAEISILTTYFRLRNQNYRWMWYSFFTGASSMAWLFGYCVYNCRSGIARSHGQFSALLFFGYAFVGSVFAALFSGTVGFLASYIFARHVQQYV